MKPYETTVPLNPSNRACQRQMATAIAKRSATDRSAGSLFRQFSSTSADAPPSPAAASDKPWRKKKKNLFEVAQFLPNWGIGYHMAKTHWTGVSYQITKINLYKDGRHGKAWGVAHKDGLNAAEDPKKISGVHKRCWSYIPNLPKTLNEAPKPQLEAA